MALVISFVLPLIALLATFYQAHLQRIHNRKSIKPLIQINLTDHNGLIYVHVQNNGLGPVIIEKFIFTRDGQNYYDMKECLTLDRKQYQHVTINDAVKKVLPNGTYIEVFSKQFDDKATAEEIDNVRHQLAELDLKVIGKDIYDYEVITERNLHWFARHSGKVTA